MLQERKLATGVGDEGGFAPNLESNEEALAHHRRGRRRRPATRPASRSRFALDPATTEFYDAERGVYVLAGEGRELTSAEMVDFCADLVEPLPDHLASRTAWPRRTGTAGSC